MAFVPNTAFFGRAKCARSLRSPRRDGSVNKCPLRRVKFVASDEVPPCPPEIQIKSADAMEFFRHREGNWNSWRVTHHLAFRRSESGSSEIKMQCLEKDDERIVSLCKDWDVDPTKAQGGCYVTWMATMAWDQEGENHEGSTVFALVPDDDDIRKGKMLRDRGYAEIVPIAGTYHLDEHDALNLVTPYEGGEVVEKFSFDGPDVVNRVSTVRRFGGFSTATFATETRTQGATEEEDPDEGNEELDVAALLEEMACFGGAEDSSTFTAPETDKNRFAGAGRRWGTTNSSSKPSTNSAFGSGFTSRATSNTEGKPSVNSAFSSGFGKSSSAAVRESPEDLQGISKESIDAATDYGIDLSKVPPSMRQDFAASFDKDDKNST
ncbi:Calycin [Gracilaria domingensis]|nr:Calycin [Gracilaria domingensis]